jgi:hypothetical protein
MAPKICPSPNAERASISTVPNAHTREPFNNPVDVRAFRYTFPTAHLCFVANPPGELLVKSAARVMVSWHPERRVTIGLPQNRGWFLSA